MQQGTRLRGKITKHKKFVQQEMANVEKIEPKPIEEEGEAKQEDDSSEIQNDNFLKGMYLVLLMRQRWNLMKKNCFQNCS